MTDADTAEAATDKPKAPTFESLIAEAEASYKLAADLGPSDLGKHMLVTARGYADLAALIRP